jgi:hypothetical protein
MRLLGPARHRHHAASVCLANVPTQRRDIAHAEQPGLETCLNALGVQGNPLHRRHDNLLVREHQRQTRLGQQRGPQPSDRLGIGPLSGWRRQQARGQIDGRLSADPSPRQGDCVHQQRQRTFPGRRVQSPLGACQQLSPGQRGGILGGVPEGQILFRQRLQGPRTVLFGVLIAGQVLPSICRRPVLPGQRLESRLLRSPQKGPEQPPGPVRIGPRLLGFDLPAGRQPKHPVAFKNGDPQVRPERGHGP